MSRRDWHENVPRLADGRRSELHAFFADRGHGWLEVAAVPRITGESPDTTDYVLRLDGTYCGPPTSKGPDMLGTTVLGYLKFWIDQLNKALVADGMEPVVTGVRPPTKASLAAHNRPTTR